MPRATHALLLLAATSIADAQDCSPYWKGLGSGTCTQVRHVQGFDDGSGAALFAITCNTVRRWDGTLWIPTNSGVVGDPIWFRRLDEGQGESLYVETFGGGRRLLRWNGGAWEATTPGLYEWNDASNLSGPLLHVSEPSGPVIYGVQLISSQRWFSRWDQDTGWEGVAGPFSTPGGHLVALDDGNGEALYLVGRRYINNQPVGGLARWDGQQWIPILDESDRITTYRQPVAGTIAGEPAVYTIGQRAINQQAMPLSVYRTDVQGNITDLGLPIQNNQPNQMFELWTLHIADLGDGPNLFLGGGFAYDYSLPIGTRRGNIARWDGSQWHQMGVGLNGLVDHIGSATFGDTPMLFAAGWVNAIGESQVTGIASWVGCPNCYANCTGSTASPMLTINDFLCFIDRFAAKDPYADCNVDGKLDIDDFLCFIDRFAAGPAPGTSCD